MKRCVVDASVVIKWMQPQRDRFQLPLADTSAIWQVACTLAISLNHHLFDTLYHAVALCTPETQLVTADRRYYEKAASKGAIVLLNDWRL